MTFERAASECNLDCALTYAYLLAHLMRPGGWWALEKARWHARSVDLWRAGTNPWGLASSPIEPYRRRRA